jgi:hypothetical protein
VNSNIETSACDVCITITGVTMNRRALHVAQPVATFHSLLGEPTRILPAGPPAPFSHRNNHIHYYDHLGVTLNEHHYTYQIQCVRFILNTADAIHPTSEPFSGNLLLGGVRLRAGDAESELKGTTIPLSSRLAGVWSGDVLSGPAHGHRINITIDTMGRKLPSGKRSKKRLITTVSLSLEHDPWDMTHRPT